MSDERPLWVDEPGGTKLDHWIDLRDPEGWYTASVRWDGCIQLYRYWNYPHEPGVDRDGDCDYSHICDIDDEISRLQALKAKAIEHFGEGWPCG